MSGPITTDEMISMHKVCEQVIARTQALIGRENPDLSVLAAAVRDLAVVLKRPLEDALSSASFDPGDPK